LLRKKITVLRKALPAPDVSSRLRLSLLSIAVALGLLIFVSNMASGQPQSADPKQFLDSLIGDWIGICEQSTDGEKAENKYFHASIKQVAPETYTGKFDYYRIDPKTGNPLHIGQSTIRIDIAADGTATSKITGSGSVLVENKPKNQEHELTEVLTCVPGGLLGKGDGKLSVSGMPFGLGKNGKVKSATSKWSINNGVLTISQNIKVGFRALVFNKSFDIATNFKAKKGSNIASLMPKIHSTPTGAGG